MRQSVGPSALTNPTSAIPNMTPFLGNPELKARLDFPGKLTVAGERMHDQLLRRFYTAHGYQTVWTSSSGRGEPPVECSSARRKAGSRPEPCSTALRSPNVGRRCRRSSAICCCPMPFSAMRTRCRGVRCRSKTVSDDEDLTPEPVDVVAVLDAALANPDPPKLIEALAPSSPEYVAMRRAYAEYRAVAEAGSPMRRASDGRRKPERGVTGTSRGGGTAGAAAGG